MNRLMLIILAVIFAGILAIAALFAPGLPPIIYWGAVAWVMVLVFINWLTSVIIVGGSGRRDGAPGDPVGSFHGISVVAFIYTVLSLSALISYLLGFVNSRTHLALQIALFVVAAVLALMALVAAKGAAHGSASSVSQSQLVHALRRMQRMTEDPLLLSRIQEQINHVSYRLPHTSKVNSGALSQALKAIEAAEPLNVESALNEFILHIKQA